MWQGRVWSCDQTCNCRMHRISRLIHRHARSEVQVDRLHVQSIYPPRHGVVDDCQLDMGLLRTLIRKLMWSIDNKGRDGIRKMGWKLLVLHRHAIRHIHLENYFDTFLCSRIENHMERLTLERYEQLTAQLGVTECPSRLTHPLHGSLRHPSTDILLRLQKSRKTCCEHFHYLGLLFVQWDGQQANHVYFPWKDEQKLLGQHIAVKDNRRRTRWRKGGKRSDCTTNYTERWQDIRGRNDTRWKEKVRELGRSITLLEVNV